MPFVGGTFLRVFTLFYFFTFLLFGGTFYFFSGAFLALSNLAAVAEQPRLSLLHTCGIGGAAVKLAEPLQTKDPHASRDLYLLRRWFLITSDSALSTPRDGGCGNRRTCGSV